MHRVRQLAACAALPCTVPVPTAGCAQVPSADKEHAAKENQTPLHPGSKQAPGTSGSGLPSKPPVQGGSSAGPVHGPVQGLKLPEGHAVAASSPAVGIFGNWDDLMDAEEGL